MNRTGALKSIVGLTAIAGGALSLWPAQSGWASSRPMNATTPERATLGV